MNKYLHKFCLLSHRLVVVSSLFSLLEMIVVLILVVNLSLISANAKSWGHIRHGQVLLFDQFFNSRATESEELLPQKDFFYSTRGVTITAIHVTDLTGTEGGNAIVYQGGVGYTFVKMKLIPEGRKLLLNVEIFGCHDERFVLRK